MASVTGYSKTQTDQLFAPKVNDRPAHGLDVGFAIGFPEATSSATTINGIAAKAKALGGRRIRIIISPYDVGSGPSYTWTRVDQQFAAAKAAGLSPHVLFEQPRNGAGTAFVTPTTAVMTPLITAAAARYKDHCSTWEICNEVNHQQLWGGAPSASAYKTILQAAYTAIHAAQPHAVVVTAGLMQVNNVANQTISPVDFLTGLYSAGAQPFFDAVGNHPYTVESGIDPAAPVPSEASNAFLRDQALYDVMVANGDSGKQVWWSEVGFPTVSSAAALGYTVSQAQQQKYLTTLLQVASRRPWVGPVLVYTVRDLGSDTTDPENAYGQYTIDGTPKASVQWWKSVTKPTSVGILGEAVAPRVSLGSLYRPMTDVISTSVLTTDQYVTSLPNDYTNQWGTRWDATTFNTQGQNLVAATPGSPANGCVNSSSGRYVTSGSTTLQFGSTIDVEFMFTGDKLDIMMSCGGGYFDTQVYIEDQGVMRKAKALPLTGSATGTVYRSLRFAERATRRIRVVLPYGPNALTWTQIVHERSAILTRSPDRPLIVTTGDSYFEPAGTYNPGSARSFACFGMIDQLIEATGFAVARCAQGGTGYFNDGSGSAGSLTATYGTAHSSPFGSTSRIGAYTPFLGAAKPVLFLVNGTINDGGLSGDGTTASQAAMQARVTALFDAVAALDPLVGIAAIGPEPLNDSAASGVHAVNRLGIKAAVDAHGQGVGFADANNPAAPWWTGTGYENSVSTSQQAQMVGSDQIHPNWFGHKYYGARIAAALASMRVLRDRAERVA